ncbi:uncharacterized protein K460DRAFT_53205 [Cucurbitaria berberidis CBS 394.84]|uniref:Uncharacterized protein n=1 Tax=Cucurbitaria berberidis CBS 394.84 TaxID=1168544 RepID=A0A9P4GKM3_9PLEO|nr:uncharacterized protein K460DRAFT_53205 [Cucurbitaria berberidis CBS 394.84]KAF1847081.1 hypothetical protein K460DRAFT_53205 [Cucurbitaria berberidis CBS 394.84]
MPRPCQKRRASAAANRKPKPAAPPPIRHKARQKAIHNARRGRGRGRGNMSGGRPSRNQHSGEGTEQDFISFASTGNNFHMLRRAGTQNDPIALDGIEDSELEDGELMTDDDSDSDSMDDLDMYDAEDMMINVQMDQSFTGKGKTRRAEVMFTIPHAISIYRGLRQTGFQLLMTKQERYGAQEVDTTSELASYNSLAPSPSSRQSSMSSATSEASDALSEPHNPASDYMFNWGKYSGQYFADVPEHYLRTIGGQLDIYEVKHPGLREAFEYYRPGQGRTATTLQPRSQPPPQPSQSRQAAPRQQRNIRPNAQSPSTSYTFDKGAHKGKRLHEVPENYLRTLEGMKDVINKWPGLRAALHDFNDKTGRRARV